MKKLNYLTLLLLLTTIACNSKETTTKKIAPTDEHIVKTGTYYSDSLDANMSIVLAPEITYDITIKNPDQTDEWTSLCLEQLNKEALINMIFNAIYNQRIQAYNYSNESVMSINEVKKLEKEYERSRIGKMQFIEEWYFNENTFEFGKRVKSIMLAYELYDLNGNVRGYKAGVMIHLKEYKKTSK